MASEMVAEVRVQRSVQNFCPHSKTESTSYFSNVRAPNSPHEVLTLNIVITSADREKPYSSGTVLSVRGRLGPGSKGAMFNLYASEHLRVDRRLSEISSTAEFTVFGEVLKKSHFGEECLVIATSPEQPACFG